MPSLPGDHMFPLPITSQHFASQHFAKDPLKNLRSTPVIPSFMGRLGRCCSTKKLHPKLEILCIGLFILQSSGGTFPPETSSYLAPYLTMLSLPLLHAGA